MGGYDIDLHNGFILQPAVMIKTDLVTTQFDLNAAATYNNQIWEALHIVCTMPYPLWPVTKLLMI